MNIVSTLLVPSSLPRYFACIVSFNLHSHSENKYIIKLFSKEETKIMRLICLKYNATQVFGFTSSRLVDRIKPSRSHIHILILRSLRYDRFDDKREL